MEKTLRQIADDIGVDKQRVYRYVKKHRISEAYQSDGVMYYDDATQTRIKSEFLKNDAVKNAHRKNSDDTVRDAMIDALTRELDEKNRQIESLLSRLEDAQKLQALAERRQEEAEQRLLLLEDKHKKSWLKRIFE